MLSEADLLRLDALRLRRFEELFAGYLANSVLLVQYQQLTIVLPSQDAAIALLADPDMVLWFAGLVLVVETVEVHVDSNCIWSGCTCNESALNWEESKQGSLPMPAATLEAPTAVQVTPIPTAEMAPLQFQRLRSLGDVVEQLAQMTGRRGQELLEEIKASARIQIFEFGGELLVDVSSVDQLVDDWATSLKGRLRDFSPVDTNRNNNGSTRNSANGGAIAPAKTARSTAKKGTAKTAAKKPPGGPRAKSKTTPKGTARKTAS